MKRYQDIAGDGGSRILEQVLEQRARIADGLGAVRHLVAVASGKGGVGKSTLTLHLANALRARGHRIAILDADFNGPSQARMAGVQGALFVPGHRKVALPRTATGIGIFSLGSLIPESDALEFESEPPSGGATACSFIGVSQGTQRNFIADPHVTIRGGPGAAARSGRRRGRRACPGRPRAAGRDRSGRPPQDRTAPGRDTVS